jgi:hypothetical protein
MTQTAVPTYTALHLETAACLWESVLEMEAAKDSEDDAARIRALQIITAREMIGSSGLRLTVIGWTDAVDVAWKAIDDPTGNCPGQYGDSFDWDFVPGWIIENVDWSDPESPCVRTHALTEEG